MQQLQGALVHVLRCQASHGQSGGQLPIHGGLAATAPDLLMLRDLASQVLALPSVMCWSMNIISEQRAVSI